jgi:hypothetical protein
VRQDKLPADFLRQTGLLWSPVFFGGLPRQTCPPHTELPLSQFVSLQGTHTLCNETNGVQRNATICNEMDITA